LTAPGPVTLDTGIDAAHEKAVVGRPVAVAGEVWTGIVAAGAAARYHAVRKGSKLKILSSVQREVDDLPVGDDLPDFPRVRRQTGGCRRHLNPFGNLAGLEREVISRGLIDRNPTPRMSIVRKTTSSAAIRYSPGGSVVNEQAPMSLVSLRAGAATASTKTAEQLSVPRMRPIGIPPRFLYPLAGLRACARVN
jgi:hypothetical protein